MALFPVGFAYRVQTATAPYSVSRYFSLATFSQLIGILTLVAGLGSSMGPYVFGLLRDLSGTYTWSLLGSAAAALVAATLFAVIAKHPYRHTD